MGRPPCIVEKKPTDPKPFLDNGQLNFSAHDVGWIISGSFAIAAIAASIWLINKHLTFYSRPQEQRQIVRILFMVPIYAVTSFGSYFFWEQSIYWELVRDCYEAFIIHSFFYLMITCIAKQPQELKMIFKDVKVDKWMFPLCWLSYKPKSGMDFLWLMKWCILQYTVLRPTTTLIAVVTQYYGLYCASSYSPMYSHIWMTGTVSISVSVAMFCIFQLFVSVKDRLTPYGMVMKLFSVKAIVFIIFWQGILIGVIAHFGFIRESEYWSVDQIEVGISAILTCFEMMVFGFVHIKAFSYLSYRAKCVPLPPPAGQDEFDPSTPTSSRYQRTGRWSSMRDVLDIRDLFREMSSGSKYLCRKLRGLDGELDRHDDFEIALDQPRRGTVSEKYHSLHDDEMIEEEVHMVSSESRVMDEIEEKLRKVKQMGTEDYEVIEPDPKKKIGLRSQQSEIPCEGLQLIIDGLPEIHRPVRTSQSFSQPSWRHQTPPPTSSFREGIRESERHMNVDRFGSGFLPSQYTPLDAHDLSYHGHPPSQDHLPRFVGSQTSHSISTRPSLNGSSHYYDPFNPTGHIERSVYSAPRQCHMLPMDQDRPSSNSYDPYSLAHNHHPGNDN